MVSESGICVSKCNDDSYNDQYFCTPRCSGGYAFIGECVDECPLGMLIGRDVK